MTRPRLLVAGAALALAAAGLWLWSREGVGVWLENAVAYCF